MTSAFPPANGCCLFHGPALVVDTLGPIAHAPDVTLCPAVDLFNGRGSDSPAVFLMDASLCGRIIDLKQLPTHVVVVAADTRMITIADIFDALTAADRPYKPALPVERALDIMRSEANDGLLEVDLVQIMIDAQLYRHVLDSDWRAL